MIKLFLGNTLQSCMNAVIGKIGENGLNDNHHVVIIPDSHSLTAEKVIFERLGINGSMNIEAVSFTRLARKVLGVEIGHTLSKQGAVLFFKKAINNVQEQLVQYKAASKTDGFAGEMYAVIASVRNNGIKEDDLEKATLELEGTTGDKAKDILLLHKEYMKILKAKGFSDSTSRLDSFMEKAPQFDKVANSYFYLYGFDSLSKKQMEIIATLGNCSKGVFIGLPYLNNGGNCSLYPNDVVERLINYLDEGKISYEIDKDCYEVISAPFDVLHDNLFNLIDARTQDEGKVTIFKEVNSYEQYNAVAREIVRLVRREKLRYKDIVVIDCEDGASIDLKEIFSRYGIPHFIDERYNLTSTIVFKYVSAIFELVRYNYRLDKVRTLIKSPLFSSDTRLINAFENYVLERNLSCGGYDEPFEEEQFEELRKKLKGFESLGKCKKVSAFTNEIKEILKAENFSALFDIAVVGYEQQEALNRQSLERLKDILGEYEKLIGDDEESLVGFAKMLASSCEAEEVALIPRFLDAVYVGSLRESCIIKPKVVFVINATYINLPKEQGYQAIISALDMDRLEKGGVKLYPTPIDKIREDRFAFIDLISGIEKYLYIGYPEVASDGSKNKPSQAIKDMLEIFSLKKECGLNAKFDITNAKKEDAVTVTEDVVAHPDNAFYTYLTNESIRQNEEMKQRVYATLSDNERAVINKKERPLPSPDLKYTFYDDLHTSNSQVERYFSCPYAHYLQYGLKVQDRKEGVLRVNDVGTLVHAVLERYFKKVTKAGLRSLKREELETMADSAIQEAFSDPGLAYLTNDPSVKYRLNRLRRECKQTALDLTDNVLKGSLEPSYFELSFGTKSEKSSKKEKLDEETTERMKNAVHFQTPFGDITFNGSIDRVDVATIGQGENAKKVAVAIDYKTGSIEEDLDNVYYGKKVQLYLYLMALREGLKLNPVGSFYLPIKSGYTSTGNNYRFRGQFIFNEQMIEMLDAGKYQEAIQTGATTESTNIPLNFTLKENKAKELVLNTRSKKNVLQDEDQMNHVMAYLEQLIPLALEEIGNGYIEKSPLGEGCKYCYYKDACGGTLESEFREHGTGNTPLYVDLSNCGGGQGLPIEAKEKDPKPEILPPKVTIEKEEYVAPPEELKLTDEQNDAIIFDKKSKLVSASAGSGKTRIMVERILQYLEKGNPKELKKGENEEKIDITRLMIITFTKASASDMREKLTEKLTERIRREKDVEVADYFRKQLNALPFAYIGTIDSVCGQIYKKYFEVLGTSPLLDMLGQEESESLRAKARKDVFEEKIIAGDEGFDMLSEYYANAKGDGTLADVVDRLLNFLSAQENPDAFLDYALQEAQVPLLSSKAVLSAIEEIKEEATELYDYHLNLEKELLCVDPNKKQTTWWNKVNQLGEQIATVIHNADANFDEIRNVFAKKAINAPSMSKAPAGWEELCEKINLLNKKVLNEKSPAPLRDKCNKLFPKSVAECIADDEEGRNLIEKLLQLVKEIRVRHIEYKLEENKNDFEDVERKVLEIFQNKTICEEFKKSIGQIYCDEYQDTNRLQEAIFLKITRQNRFLVGDLKQAIYGFREADPYIFQEIQEDFDDGQRGDNKPLSKNFRSSQPILTFVDRVFSEIMTKKFGGTDYASMQFGQAGLNKGANGPYPYAEVRVIVKPDKEDKNKETQVYSVKEGKKKTGKENENDLYIADKIEEMVGHDLIAKGDKTDKTRTIEYKDICILYRSKTKIPELQKIFDERGIPYIAEGVNGSAEGSDVDAINAFLRVVDNYMEDKPLARAMLSYMGGFDEEELSQIRKYDYTSKYFHEAVVKYSENNSDALAQKLNDFFSRLKEYKRLSNLVDVPTLIGHIVTETGYLSTMLAENKSSRIATYNAFIQTLRSKKFALTLQAYVEFLNSGVKLELPVPSSGGNAVTIMTIHGSKGLEFPVVFVANANQDFNTQSTKEEIVLDSTYGLGIKSFNEEDQSKTKGTRRISIERGVRLKQKMEELRLMYVAFTRARYRLYVVGSVENKKGDDPFIKPKHKNSFLDWVLLASSRNPDIEIVRGKYVPWRGSPEELQRRAEESEKKTEEGKTQEVENGVPMPLSFSSYPYKASTTISNKYSVTSINSQSHSDEEIVKIPVLGAQSIQKGVTNIQKGIAYHKVMELIDFNLSGEEEISAFIRELVARGEIEEGIVEPSNISRGLAHPIFASVRKGKCRCEQEFIYYAPAKLVVEKEKTLSVAEKEALESDRVLIQGVMDLIIEGEENIILDYKVSGASEEVLRERYRTQLDLYAKAYEEMTGKKVHKKALFVLNRGEIIEF